MRHPASTLLHYIKILSEVTGASEASILRALGDKSNNIRRRAANGGTIPTEKARAGYALISGSAVMILNGLDA